MIFPIVYAVKHKDFDVRMASRSGGIFTALSDKILDDNGVVYGCVLNDKFEAVHTRAENREERNRMRGSKYIQSDLKDTFKNIQKDLKDNRKVLFSGTSCQVAGLKAFLRKDYSEQLLCVDIVCHGVPSPLVWKEYIKWQEKNANGKCIAVDFRNKKKYGWADHIETLTFKEDNGNIKNIDSDIFKNLFFNHQSLRPACFKCPYKSITHPADITIADFWGIDNAAPGFNDNKGVSLVLINNNQGIEFWNCIKDCLEYRECDIEKSMQPPLKEPFSKPENRDKFWNDFHNKPFSYIAKKYGKRSFVYKLKKKLRKIKKLLK